MKNPFAKKSKNDYDNFENYDSDFYRGDEEEEDGVVGDDGSFPTRPTVTAPETGAPAKKAPAGGQSGNMLKVVKPRGIEDGRDIADYLIKGYTVVMNIEELDRPTVMRLVDFLLGALYVLGGELRRVTKTTLVTSPRSGEMSSDEDEADEEDGMN